MKTITLALLMMVYLNTSPFESKLDKFETIAIAILVSAFLIKKAIKVYRIRKVNKDIPT